MPFAKGCYRGGSAESVRRIEREGIKMKKFHIFLNGCDYGVFKAQTKEHALDALAQEAGYKDWQTAKEMTSSPTDDIYIVEE